MQKRGSHKMAVTYPDVSSYPHGYRLMPALLRVDGSRPSISPFAFLC